MNIKTQGGENTGRRFRELLGFGLLRVFFPLSPPPNSVLTELCAQRSVETG